jgi:hypothetical protein
MSTHISDVKKKGFLVYNISFTEKSHTKFFNVNLVQLIFSIDGTREKFLLNN